MQTLEVEDWGLIAYDEALRRQEETVQKVADEKSAGVLVVCHHPPTVTLGRKTQPDDLQGWKGPTFEIARGGRATYHGPSQVVMYPIWNLDFAHPGLPHRDLHWYLRNLENVMIRTVAEFGIEAQGRSLQKNTASKGEDIPGTEETGLWVGSQKLASIGIGVRRWVSFHGLALNVDDDPQAFVGIRPCGFAPQVMTSMEKLLGRHLDHELVKTKLIQNFLALLNPPLQ